MWSKNSPRWWNEFRLDLGDSLTGMKGTGLRAVGRDTGK